MSSMECSLEIDAGVDVVRERWSGSDRLPNFDRMAGDRVTWDRGGERHTGVVRFEAVGAGRSRVTVELDRSGDGEAPLADRLVVRRRLYQDLAAFGEQVEGGGAPAAPDPSEGAGADSPAHIPARGWADVVKRTFAQLKSDNVSVVAGGVAFYIFLALVPSLIAVISVYGLVADPADVERQIGPYLTAVPAEAADLIRTQVEAITAQEGGSLGLGLVVSVVLALLGASKGMLALVTALNIAYDEAETRKFLQLRAVAAALTVAVALAAVVGTAGMVVAGNVADRLGTVGKVAVVILRWPLLAAFFVLGLAVLYRYAPDRTAPAWRWVTPGALVAMILWILGSVGFSVYVGNFGNYNETYGSLAAVVVLLLWLLLTAYAIVFGAELDRETERQAAG